jgi:DNA-binding GntR family transcriptional regulator
MPRPRKPRLDPGMETPALVRRELWEGVAESLRAAIVSGSIPAGSNLVEADVADRFGVSRGPVRDAFRDLAREGLVVDLPRRGTIVSTLTFSDTRDVYAVREGLEAVGARMAIERASEASLEGLGAAVLAMEAAWDRKADYAETLAADLEFHRELVGLSANPRLIPLYEQMLSQTQLLVRSAALVNPRLRLGLRRSAHREILDAVRGRDVDAARRAIAEHYAYAEERLFGRAQDPSHAGSDHSTEDGPGAPEAG